MNSKLEKAQKLNICGDEGYVWRLAELTTFTEFRDIILSRKYMNGTDKAFNTRKLNITRQRIANYAYTDIRNIQFYELLLDAYHMLNSVYSIKF